MSILDRIVNLFGTQNQDGVSEPAQPMIPPSSEPEAPMIIPQEPVEPVDISADLPLPEEEKEGGLGI